MIMEVMNLFSICSFYYTFPFLSNETLQTSSSCVVVGSHSQKHKKLIVTATSKLLVKHHQRGKALHKSLQLVCRRKGDTLTRH